MKTFYTDLGGAFVSRSGWKVATFPQFCDTTLLIKTFIRLSKGSPTIYFYQGTISKATKHILHLPI